MRITNAASYAITSLARIAAAPSGQFISNSTICSGNEMPERFVLQILRHLVNAGILTSTRGVRGGYRLAKLAKDVTLLDVVEAVDRPIRTNPKLPSEGLSKASAKLLDGTMSSIAVDAANRLASVTLAELKLAKGA